jgi:soluble P-type ATPase
MMPRPKAKLQDVAIALQEMQSALPDVLKPAEERSEQEMLPAHVVVTESSDLLLSTVVIEDERAISDSIELAAEEDARAIGECAEVVSEEENLVAIEAKRKIAATLSKFKSQRKGKRATDILAANSADVGVEAFVPNNKVVESAPNSGGLSDYLLQLQVSVEDEIW